MSATTSLLQACPNVQGILDNEWANCHSQAEPLPFLEFILSPSNRQPIVDMILSNNGTIRRAELTYFRRIAESAVESNQSITACAATNKEPQQKATYDMDINQNEQYKFAIDIQDFIRSCEGSPEILAKQIQQGIDALERKIATKTAAELALAQGNWASDVSNVTANFLQVATQDSDDRYLAQAYVKMKIAKAKTGFCAPTVTFAGESLFEYYQATRVGCCADNGLNVGDALATFGEAVIWDRRIESTTFSADPNKAMMLQLGAAQLLNFSLFEGQHALSQPTYTRQSIISPRTGLKIDMTMRDDCGKIQVVLTATTKLISLPNDMFEAGDVYEGVNYITGIEVNNP
jgi:hypothetical protein